MNAEYIAYAAGFLEADGCVHLPSSVRIVNKNPDVLDWFLEKFGGKVRPKGVPKDCFEWNLHGDDARKFLEDVYPFLIFKKPQVDIWISYRNTVRSRGSEIPHDVICFRENLKREMKQVKKDACRAS